MMKRADALLLRFRHVFTGMLWLRDLLPMRKVEEKPVGEG